MTFKRYIGFANGDPRNAAGAALGVPLRPEAADGLIRMDAEFYAVFGKHIVALEGMRSVATQLHYWRLYTEPAYYKIHNGGKRGNVAAQPSWDGKQWVGTSWHGEGLAVDLGGPLNNASSAEHKWVAANCERFGWWWSGRNFGEPWHFEFDGRNGNMTVKTAVPPTLRDDTIFAVECVELARIYIVTPNFVRWTGKSAAVAGINRMTGRPTVKMGFNEFYPLWEEINAGNLTDSALAGADEFAALMAQGEELKQLARDRLVDVTV